MRLVYRSAGFQLRTGDPIVTWSAACFEVDCQFRDFEVPVRAEPATGRDQFTTPDGNLPTRQRAIFRSEAIEHYLQEQEKVVLPRLVSPHVFVYLWILAVLLLVAGFLIGFWPVIRQWAGMVT